jgi:hypothetical protein
MLNSTFQQVLLFRSTNLTSAIGSAPVYTQPVPPFVLDPITAFPLSTQVGPDVQIYQIYSYPKNTTNNWSSTTFSTSIVVQGMATEFTSQLETGKANGKVSLLF